MKARTCGALDISPAALAESASSVAIVFVLDTLEIVANEEIVLVHPALVGARQQEPLRDDGALR